MSNPTMSPLSTPTPTPDFDPFTQSFTLLLPDGVTSFSVDIPTLNAFISESTNVCANYASQIGASFIMLLVVLLTTREAKRRSPIFILNIVSLILSTLRSLLQTLYWVGPFNEAYAYFSGDYDRIPRSAYANSIASLVMTLLFLITVEASLVLQTNIICVTLCSIYRSTIMALSMVISLLTIGFRFAVTVENAEAITNLYSFERHEWLASTALIMETISIWFFCLVFVGKLAAALWARKQMGLQRWGPMQIICIMGGCTMIIPSIFAVLEYFPNTTFPEAGSLALTLVAIFLPLSSVWAAAAIEGSSPVLNHDTSGRKLSQSTTGTATGRGGTRNGSTSYPKTHVATIEHQSWDTYEEDGVRVEKSYCVSR